MSVYVLIHGAWHASFSWHKVVPLLERAGHTVKAPDLPGHGADPTPRGQVTLKAYVDRVGELLDGCAEPAILVGHSMGGVVITQAGEEWPEKIAALVYLAGFLPQNGQSLREDLAQKDAESQVPPGFVFSEDGLAVSIRQDVAPAAFYGGCSDEDQAYAMARLQAQPLPPFGVPVTVSEGRYGKIPRFYIHCLEDRAVTMGLQRAQVQAVPCQTFTLSTGHSPFFSDPEALTRHLLAVGSR